jgi:hypothetical protein
VRYSSTVARLRSRECVRSVAGIRPTRRPCDYRHIKVQTFFYAEEAGEAKQTLSGTFLVRVTVFRHSRSKGKLFAEGVNQGLPRRLQSPGGVSTGQLLDSQLF